MQIWCAIAPEKKAAVDSIGAINDSIFTFLSLASARNCNSRFQSFQIQAWIRRPQNSLFFQWNPFCKCFCCYVMNNLPEWCKDRARNTIIPRIVCLENLSFWKTIDQIVWCGWYSVAEDISHAASSSIKPLKMWSENCYLWYINYEAASASVLMSQKPFSWNFENWACHACAKQSAWFAKYIHWNLVIKNSSTENADNNPWIKYICSMDRRNTVLI